MSQTPPPFQYEKPFSLEDDSTEYILLSDAFVESAEFEGSAILKVDPAALTLLTETAMSEIAFKLRTSHLEQVAAILDDSEATENDRTIAWTLLRNAEVSAHGVLPFCQDTGTAIILGKKGQSIWTGGGDEVAIAQGVYNTYTKENLRYSQTAPLSMYEEVNTGCNLPAQIDLLASDGDAYEFLFVAKGGGSANKSFLFQETKALLNPANLEKFCIEKMGTLGTSACPPYHIAIVIGGTSAEATMKTVKLASTKYYDSLPTIGNQHGRAFRDKALEAKLLDYTREMGYGAQFGGKYFALDIRVIRLPRHGASCPVGLGVSCSADRNARGRIDKNGVWLEKLESNPGRFLPAEETLQKPKNPVAIDLDRPMKEVLAELSRYPVATPLSLSGTIVVARDMAHAKLKEQLDRGEGLPEYFKNHPIYYAGPAKTPEGKASGSFGPTTAGRMDAYVEPFQAAGGSMIMLAKGNRSPQVTESCKSYGGFYLGSIGGPAALLAEHHIKKVEVLEFAELGMEAIWEIEVKDFPAYILVDDKGNDFFAGVREACDKCALKAFETARANAT
ncbi:MAG: Fumarate hydratase class I, aerobic [Opitutia bacterium UBA7350]|nr:MAG: Fumarate hydratase class I, aerobic [Opitutae bacterium UBA7350]